MNFITVMEPYASALIFGFKKEEFRNFKIPLGRCGIHVSSKIAVNSKKLHEYYSSIGANLVSQICKINYNKENDTEHCEWDDFNKKIILKNEAELLPDYDMAITLFRRNMNVTGNIPFLLRMYIGDIYINEHKKSDEKNYKFINICEKSYLNSIEKSKFMIGKVGLFKTKD